MAGKRINMETIRFLLQDTNAPEAIRDFINANIENFSSAITFSQQEQNERVEVGEVTAKEVRILDTGIVEIDFRYEWSYFSGCKDISDAGIETETVQAILVGGAIELVATDRHEPRTTLNEF